MSEQYRVLLGEADYRAGLDRVIALAQREIRLFDADLIRTQIDAKERIAALAGFLSSDPQRRIRIVLHDPGPAGLDMPRLLAFLSKHGHAIEVRQSPDNLRHLADTHLLADGRHGVRRFHVAQARSALVVEDSGYIQPWWDRFNELWELSQPCLSPSTGL